MNAHIDVFINYVYIYVTDLFVCLFVSYSKLKNSVILRDEVLKACIMAPGLQNVFGYKD